MRQWIMRGAACLLALQWFWAVVPASAKDICFPNDKTPHCLTDPFSDYWDNNGGLPVFGYPITPTSRERNRDTGQVYRTQWMERNRFEFHPENTGTPYEILLGLLGKDRLAQLGRGIEPPESGAKRGCLWFKETGHNVCDQGNGIGFKTYWETHGLAIEGLDSYARSLQLFGLPLTEPRMETNSSGDTVLTQWFERARFEWHPNNPNEYKVLLGLLGKEVRSGQTPLPPPSTTPPVTGTCTTNAPAPASNGQAWVVYPSIASNGQQIVCARLLVNNQAQNAVMTTFEVVSPNGTKSYIALTDNSGVALLEFRIGSHPANTTIRINVTFSTGQTATTSFTVK